jgi:S-formylglutathione hydrolase FrmB
MAFFQASFFSTALKRQARFNAILPNDSLLPPSLQPKPPFKTVYLLHGYWSNASFWLTDLLIGELAVLHGVAIIAPDGENNFYVDNEKKGELYSEFIGHELVNYTRKIFPLSDKREDTIIGGFSMGGYGALYNGLRYGDIFGHIIALSSAIVSPDFFGLQNALDLIAATRDYFESVFGDLKALSGSDKDLLALPGKIAAAGKPIPDIYHACGYNDIFAPLNRRFDELLGSLHIPHVYEEGPGTHETPVWDRYLRRGLERIDLDRPDPAKLAALPNPFWRDN